MTSLPRRIAIVDAYSSANLLAPAFQRRGFECVHVQSTYDLLPIYPASFCEGDFVANIRHRGDLDETLTALNRYAPECVIVGTEVGVELADLLSSSMGLASNGTALSAARRDKFQMAEQLLRCGLRSIRQLRANNPDEIVAFAERVVGFPVVLKPMDSGGNDSVYCCKNRGDIRSACSHILGSINKLGRLNQLVLAQERIQGTNYVVDTVSCGGQHRAVSIWQIGKGEHNGAEFVYEYNHLLPSEGAVQAELVSYTLQVLDSLGIQYGPAHSELVFDDQGPVLIETGARVHGGGFPQYTEKSLGHSQIDRTVDCFIDPDAFFEKTQGPYRLNKHLVIADLISPVAGTLRSWRHLDRIREMQSLHEIHLSVSPGESIHVTRDVFTEPGYVVLVHEDVSRIWEDYAEIRRLERQGLYELEQKSHFSQDEQGSRCSITR